MTIWNWRCLVADCGEQGTADSYDAVIEAAGAHNAEAKHSQPAISYGNDDPVEVVIESGPTPPSVYDLLNEINNGIQGATDLDGIKAAFASVNASVSSFVTKPPELI